MSKLSRNEAASLHSKMLREMTLLDVMCPVCRGILIEPVTMPCYHCLCKLCFERTMEEASLSCPMCRKRIGGWFRKNSKTGKLIDSKLWKEIKTQFPHQVGAKLKGDDDGIPEDVLTQFAPQQQLCDTGEIRREYEHDLKKLQEEEKRRQEEEESKSTALIKQLQEEEMQLRLRLKQAEMDERLARQLQDEASQSPGLPEPRDGDKENSGAGAMPAPNKGPMDAFLTLKKAAGSSRCLSPADLNGKARPPAAGVGGKPRCASDASAGSTDSIHQEMHHFKPIRAVPRTPPKRMPDGKVVEPKLIKSVPRNLDEVYDEMSVPGKSVVPAAGLGHCVDLSSPSSSADSGAAPSAFAGFGSGSKRDRASLRPSGEGPGRGEPPDKRARGDPAVDACPYEQRVCEGRKVIAIIRRDTIAEVGGHARRLDADGRPDSDSSDANWDDPDVARVVGVEPEGAPCRLAAAARHEAYEEQLRIERAIRQERADYELALRLDQHWASLDRKVDRTKGSPRAYELRNARRARAGRQSTLDEFPSAPRLRHC